MEETPTRDPANALAPAVGEAGLVRALALAVPVSLVFWAGLATAVVSARL